MASLAALSPHLEQRSRACSALRLAAPAMRPASNPSSVLVAPHPVQSIRSPAPKRTTSAIVLMCLVLMPPDMPTRTIRERLNRLAGLI